MGAPGVLESYHKEIVESYEAIISSMIKDISEMAKEIENCPDTPGCWANSLSTIQNRVAQDLAKIKQIE